MPRCEVAGSPTPIVRWTGPGGEDLVRTIIIIISSNIIIIIITGSKYEQYHLAGRAVIGRRQEEVQAILHLLRFLCAHYLRIRIQILLILIIITIMMIVTIIVLITIIVVTLFRFFSAHFVLFCLYRHHFHPLFFL